ncbi:hypothetical protein BT96DRAFT_945589 [Gymnopus androsaceus JB14]|uniref:Uncharacterized protein n=1 Tax=Gymnopus androsaceus JB14 TaxID=1447944 RepID=A0A6A4H1B0_9AGAR|nr:hypothetical protein BT96DRAFT_945589 [Gymnopus androsaceus JB14]
MTPNLKEMNANFPWLERICGERNYPVVVCTDVMRPFPTFTADYALLLGSGSPPTPPRAPGRGPRVVIRILVPTQAGGNLAEEGILLVYEVPEAQKLKYLNMKEDLEDGRSCYRDRLSAPLREDVMVDDAEVGVRGTCLALRLVGAGTTLAGTVGIQSPLDAAGGAEAAGNVKLDLETEFKRRKVPV